MNQRIGALLLLLASAFSATSAASEYRFSYSQLYSKLKYNLKSEYTDVGVGLYFIDHETLLPCNVERSWMEQEEHFETLEFPSDGRMPLPVDANLKSANPLVYVHTDSSKQCDYSVALVANPPYSLSLTDAYLATTTQQFQMLLEDISGMFSSWFAPTISGITLEFPDLERGTIGLSNGSVVEIESHRAHLVLSDFSQEVTATLPTAPSRIMPYIANK